jgi:DNA polymerase-3 subunit delta
MAKGRCFLFLGPELGEKLDAVEELRREMKAASGAAPEESSFYAGETPMTDIVSVLRNGSLFAESRLIFIKNAEAVKKEDAELLASYMKNPQTDTTLILLSEASSLAKALETAAGGNKRVFWELFENQKTRWVASFFQREGCRITEDGIAAILELVENNTEALRRECSRLILFLGKERPAGAAEVEAWLSHTREESAFTLFSRIAEGDLTKSLETLHTLLAAKTAPQAILAGLAWCFRRLRDYRSLVDSGVTDRFEFKKMGFSSPQAQRDYSLASRLYPRPDSCLALTAEFDILTRSAGSALDPLLMDLYLYKLITAPDAPREKWFYY